MNMNLRNKIKGAVYGFAIGDAMGATTEFMTDKQIKLFYGEVNEIVGGGWLELQPGEVTDDTQMSICVMKAIMQKPEDVGHFKTICSDYFVDWLKTKPKDVGNQCLKSILLLMSGKDIPYNKDALGNGSLMRAMPLAILNLGFHNICQGTLTHNNVTCSKFITDYTRILQKYLYNNYNYKYSPIIKKPLEPTGYIENTFYNSLYWSNKDSFREAIIGAVNHGGDADTIAAITGSLAGAKYGFDDIPKNWVNKINPEVKETLDSFISFAFDCLQV